MTDTRPVKERNLPSIQIGSRGVTAYEPGLALEVCEKIAEGQHLKDILSLPRMPVRSTWYRWCMLHPALNIAYETARKISAEGIEEDCLALAELLVQRNADVKSVLELDQIKVGLAQMRWSAARRNPEKFAEKPAASTIVPIQINTSLGIGEPGKTTSIYTVRAVVPAKEEGEIVDVEPEGIEVPEAETPELVTEWREGQKKERTRVARKHKTEAQTRATITARLNAAKKKGAKP